MSSTDERKNYNTTLDEKLIRKIKILAAEYDKKQNELLEEGIRLVLNNISSSKASGNEFKIENDTTSEDRINKNTTLNRELMAKLRMLKARNDINKNVLIEEGMKLVIKKYQDKYTRGAANI